MSSTVRKDMDGNPMLNNTTRPDERGYYFHLCGLMQFDMVMDSIIFGYGSRIFDKRKYHPLMIQIYLL